MNKIIISFITITLMCLVVSPTFANPQQEAVSITLEDLANLSPVDREGVIKAYNTIKDSKAGTISITSQAKEAVEIVDGIDWDGLIPKAEKIAEAIVAFGTKLGVGVESLLDSRTGVIILLIVAFKLGVFGTILSVFGSISGFITCAVGGLLFTLFLIGVNTNKKIVLNSTTKDAAGKIVSMTSTEEMVPRFNAMFARFTDRTVEKDIKAYYDNVSLYRIWASIVCFVVVFIFAVVI